MTHSVVCIALPARRLLHRYNTTTSTADELHHQYFNLPRAARIRIATPMDRLPPARTRRYDFAHVELYTVL